MAANNSDDTGEPKIDWQFPELLSNEGLVEFLRRRYVSFPDSCEPDREKLLELYHRYVIPRPQRQYHLNRGNRERTKKQLHLARKRKITHSEGSETCTKKHSLSDTARDAPLPRFMTSASITSTSSEKTEPPKSMINFDRKVIKLNSGKDRTTSSDSSCTKITISQPESRGVKLKCISEYSSQSSSLTVNTATEKGPVMQSSVKKQKRKIDEEPGNSPKKKIKRISWP